MSVSSCCIIFQNKTKSILIYIPTNKRISTFSLAISERTPTYLKVCSTLNLSFCIVDDYTFKWRVGYAIRWPCVAGRGTSLTWPLQEINSKIMALPSPLISVPALMSDEKGRTRRRFQHFLYVTSHCAVRHEKSYFV